VAELVDAADSKSAVRKDVLVRFQSRAPRLKPFTLFVKGFFYFMNWIDAPRSQSGRSQGCAPIEIGVRTLLKPLYFVNDFYFTMKFFFPLLQIDGQRLLFLQQ
jgi:hypothetical protein